MAAAHYLQKFAREMDKARIKRDETAFTEAKTKFLNCYNSAPVQQGEPELHERFLSYVSMDVDSTSPSVFL